MKKILLTLLVAMASTSTAFAQTANTSNNSTSSTNATQNATSQNAGVNAVVKQYGATHMRNESTVPTSVVGYGSFSQVSCTSSVGAGVSVPAFALVYNGPHADTNCQHVVLGDAFGRAAQLAKSVGADSSARAALSMVFYAYCTSGIADANIVQACIDEHLVKATGAVKNEHGVSVAVVMPAEQLPMDAVNYLKPSTVAGMAAHDVLAPQMKPLPTQTVYANPSVPQQVADTQAAAGPRS